MNVGLISIAIILSHFTGDWIWQSREVAINKSKHLGYLAAHIFHVGLALIPITFVLHKWPELCIYLGLHAIQDWYWWRFWSKRLDERYYENKAFYDAIALDQILHLSILIYLFIC